MTLIKVVANVNMHDFLQAIPLSKCLRDMKRTTAGKSIKEYHVCTFARGTALFSTRKVDRILNAVLSVFVTYRQGLLQGGLGRAPPQVPQEQ